jgi:hypothetical protein
MVQWGFLVAATAAALFFPSSADAQPYAAARPRRQFVTISVDWLRTKPFHFAEHPIEDLVGEPVMAARFEDHDYETRDGQTRIDVLEFRRRGRGAGVTVYPFGLSSGATLGLRASTETLPVIRIAFEGPARVDSYALTGGRAYDIGAGIFVADRSAGWGLGSQAFIAAGAGRIRSDLGDGTRVFAEGGGGLSSGPLGFDIAVKLALNRLEPPVVHKFFTFPVVLRATLSF